MLNKKRCQIYASLPITCFEVPIVGETELNLTENEIYKCLCAKAQVIEILPNGKRINLDFTNYNKDNYYIPDTSATIVNSPFVGETPEPIHTPVFTEPTPEPVLTVTTEVVEEDKEIIEVESIEEETVKADETENTEVKEEQAVAETVKSYQVASRNNNNNKKSKNKR